MKFMETPTPGITANQDLEGLALEAAIKFVDELIYLHILCPPPLGVSVVNIFPLFLVIKPNQPGQCRTIADGKQGGKNDVTWLILVI